MTCPPFCDTCGGNLGRSPNGRDCEKCLRTMPKKRITKAEFDPAGDYSHFALRTRGGGFRYYRKLPSASDLRRQATAICMRQPGYGTPAYRGDPYEAVALQQQAERMERPERDPMIYVGDGQYRRRSACSPADIERAKAMRSDVNAGRL